MITLKWNWPSCFPRLAPHFPPLLHSKKHIEFPNLGSGENRATKVFKHGWKSRLDSLACYSLIEQKNTEVFRHQLEAITAATVWNWSVKNCPRDLFRPCLKTFVARFVPNRLTAPGSPKMCRECYSVHQSGYFSHENAGNGRITFDGVGPLKFCIFYRAYRFENVGRKQKRHMSL